MSKARELSDQCVKLGLGYDEVLQYTRAELCQLVLGPACYTALLAGLYGKDTPFPPSSEYQALVRITIKANQEKVEAGFKDKECSFISDLEFKICL